MDRRRPAGDRSWGWWAVQVTVRLACSWSSRRGSQGRPMSNYRPFRLPISRRAHWEPCSTVGGGAGGNISPAVACPWAVGA